MEALSEAFGQDAVKGHDVGEHVAFVGEAVKGFGGHLPEAAVGGDHGTFDRRVIGHRSERARPFSEESAGGG